MIYQTGRLFQLIGLISMPSAVWAGAVGNSERGCITIFFTSLLVFWAGFLLTRVNAKH